MRLLTIMLVAALVSGDVAMDKPKILMVIAHEGFRDEELQRPKEILEANGYDVVIASTSLTPAKGKLGAVVKPDILLEDARAEDYQAVIFVGGPGSEIYFHDDRALTLARSANKQGKVVGAICIAPCILANAGILEGKKATVYGGLLTTQYINVLKQGGAHYTTKPVVIDGNLITAAGPKAAEAFGRAIVSTLAQ